MKKWMNDPAAFVRESLEGILEAHSNELDCVNGEVQAVVRKEAPLRGKVAIVTGGGYGHLPVFLGYVGEGWADGVAVGNVFTSPSVETISLVTRRTDGGEGVLYLYGNYTGDSMNFEMATELAAAEGIAAVQVKVSDDIASAPRADWQDRRGVAGIFFAYKIAGAAAAAGLALNDVQAVTRKACERTASIGMAFTSCQLPMADRPVFEIGDDEMEIGMGLHGEPGIRRVPMRTAETAAEEVVPLLIDDLGLEPGAKVAVLVNGLGSSSREELYILFLHAKRILTRCSIDIAGAFVGEYATSLEMGGASVTLLHLDDQLAELLHRPARSPFVSVP